MQTKSLKGAIYQEGLVVTGSHHYWQYVTILLVGGGETLWDIILSANQENKGKYWVI